MSSDYHYSSYVATYEKRGSYIGSQRVDQPDCCLLPIGRPQASESLRVGVVRVLVRALLESAHGVVEELGLAQVVPDLLLATVGDAGVEENRQGVLDLLLGTLTGLGGVASIGIGVADSESAGVVAATFACPVVAASAACVLGALISVAVNNTVARAVVPLITGIVGGLFGGVATMMFFVVLWPML